MLLQTCGEERKAGVNPSTTNGFENIFILTQGGPSDATMTFPMLAYFGLQSLQIGEAAAVSVAVMAFAAPREPHVSPHVAHLVDAHTASASTSGDPISELTPAAVPVSFQR